MPTRRYGDDEVREIFSLATTGDARSELAPAESDGLTLGELQRIGEEAGIAPARVAQAAAQLEARSTATPMRRSFGMPVGMSRVVPLPRAPTDREWEQLVAECRSTFDTPGRVTVSGNLRDWSHGNLHVAIEPTTAGYQLRLGTLKDDGIALNLAGAMAGTFAVVVGAAVAATGKPEKALILAATFGSISLAVFGANLLRLRRWARERQQQMDLLAERAVKLLSNE